MGEIMRCSGKSEHFLPHMWHPSRCSKTTNQSCVTVGEQTIQHNYMTQKCQMCEQSRVYV